MAEKTRMFSEHWYRVAQQRVALRPSVRSRRQWFRGERWRVLYDPFAHRFFRLRPAAYEFVSRLSSERTVEEVWKESLERDPNDAPGQGEVIQLLAQLYQANLLQLDLPPDAQQFFERYRKRKQQERRAYLTYIMFARFPLFDPDRLLNRLRPYVNACFSRVGLLVWLGVLLAALKVAVDNVDALVDQSQGVLAPSNLFFLYTALVLIKAIHEFGHAFAVKRYGGEVHTMGILLMIFTPIPYVDATASWAFRQRRQRVLVASAGMMVELFVAALATFVWASTSAGLVNALAYNMMFIASISTVLFNGNPLLRYDGYYILSDLLDIPNLFERSKKQLRYLTEGKLLGRPHVRKPSDRRGESIILGVYGVLSGLYRVLVFSMIILFVSQRFLLAGIIMAAICVFAWMILPTGKFIHYLITDPGLDRNRPRAIGVSVAAAALAVLLVGVIPFPSSFSAPGVVQAIGFTEIAARSSGALQQVRPGATQSVTNGTPLFQLEDPEWAFQWQAENASAAYSEALYRQALRESAADLKPIEQSLELIERRRQRLLEYRDQMQVRAPVDGLWVAGARPEDQGIWVDRGINVGFMVQTNRMLFRATVSQQESRWLFEAAGARRARVRLRGGAGAPLEAPQWLVIQAEQTTLPSPALGWFGGGDVAVRQEDPAGTDARDTFYEVRVMLPAEAASDLRVYHGRTGRVRFRVPPETLWEQGYRRVRQLLDRRG
jgi:putative peptide zinc metalloprotease protein